MSSINIPTDTRQNLCAHLHVNPLMVWEMAGGSISVPAMKY